MGNKYFYADMMDFRGDWIRYKFDTDAFKFITKYSERGNIEIWKGDDDKDYFILRNIGPL
jgi:hypothetical protein